MLGKDKRRGEAKKTDERMFAAVYAGPQYFEQKRELKPYPERPLNEEGPHMAMVYAGPSIMEQRDNAMNRLDMQPFEVGKFCPQCGTKVEPSFRFCPECGFLLTSKEV